MPPATVVQKSAWLESQHGLPETDAIHWHAMPPAWKISRCPMTPAPQRHLWSVLLLSRERRRWDHVRRPARSWEPPERLVRSRTAHPHTAVGRSSWKRASLAAAVRMPGELALGRQAAAERDTGCTQEKRDH